MARKVSEVRCNTKICLVQIKFNHGPNIVLKDHEAVQFEFKRNHFVGLGFNVSDANLFAAQDIAGLTE